MKTVIHKGLRRATLSCILDLALCGPNYVQKSEPLCPQASVT